MKNTPAKAAKRPAKPRKRKYDPVGQAERLARSESALLQEGGKRVNVRLSGPAVKAMELIMVRQGLDSQKDAIEWALAIAQ